ncbi:MAG: hypothetical protein IPP28_03155 [Xanthomonadales bacterium]|nr:hypothetical protein [Xanthomonadales bacterium]
MLRLAISTPPVFLVPPIFALERDNPQFSGAVNNICQCADLGERRLGKFMDILGSIQVVGIVSCSKDFFGQRHFETKNQQLPAIEADLMPGCANAFRRGLHSDLHAA